ncbi:hypothetical protein RRG08_004079 [Elysia crispata]|uniref:Uncharacterized protein n=1 Tax=Elysia crispata TaxID=231223 RepID=A0AAE0XVG3_9GAST|nr:hypothetical protein RRG08_004079 [Elysia crispata]
MPGSHYFNKQHSPITVFSVPPGATCLGNTRPRDQKIDHIGETTMVNRPPVVSDSRGSGECDWSTDGITPT